MANGLLTAFVGSTYEEMFDSFLEEKGLNFPGGKFLTDNLKPPHFAAVLGPHEFLPPLKTLALLMEVP